MTDLERRRLRLQNQRLTGTPFPAPEAAVRWLTAVQSQDYAGAKWALALRTAGLTDAAADAAFDAGRVLRTHVMRPTWHFVSPDDIRWLLALTAPRVHAFNGYAYRTMEISPSDLALSRRILEHELRNHRWRTRTELAAAFNRRKLAASGHRLAYLVMHAELEGVICSGPRRGKQFTYALLDERAPDARAMASVDEGLGELTLRYMRSHGPATLRDFSWWSGLTLREAKRGVEIAGKALASFAAGDLTLWMARANTTARPPSAPPALPLPNYDEYFIAYKDRASFQTPAPRTPVPIPAATFAHVLAVDGGFGGTWRRTLQSRTASVDVSVVRPLSAKVQTALGREGRRLGAFLGTPVHITAR